MVFKLFNMIKPKVMHSIQLFTFFVVVFFVCVCVHLLNTHVFKTKNKFHISYIKIITKLWFLYIQFLTLFASYLLSFKFIFNKRLYKMTRQKYILIILKKKLVINDYNKNRIKIVQSHHIEAKKK